MLASSLFTAVPAVRRFLSPPIFAVVAAASLLAAVAAARLRSLSVAAASLLTAVAAARLRSLSVAAFVAAARLRAALHFCFGPCADEQHILKHASVRVKCARVNCD